MTLRDHLRVLARRRGVLLTVLAVCAAGGALYAFLATPVYEARAELVMAANAGPQSAVLSAAAPVLSMLGEPVSALGRDDLATQVQIIDSRPSLEAAWGMMRDRPEVLDRLLRVGLSDELLEELPGIMEGLPDQPPPAQWPDEWQAVLDTLMVAPVEESEVIEVRCEAHDPARARDFANALVLAYLGRSLADARASTRRARTYVDEQLEDVEVRLAESEESLRQFGERVGTVALDESARQQIGLLVRLNEQAAVAQSTLSAQRALRNELESELATLDERVTASTVTRRNPEIVELQGELARAEAERVSLLEEYAPDSMPVRRATASVEELRARLRATAVEVVDSRQEALNPVAQEIMQQMLVAEGEEMAAEQSMRVLQQAVGRVESELAGLPDEQVALLKLQREIELLERFYLALKEKQQEYEISERAKAPAARLVTYAIAPDEPARPKKLVAIAGGLMAGILLGLLAVGLAEQLDDRVRGAEHAADAIGLPVLGVLRRRWQSGDEADDEALRGALEHLRAVKPDPRGPDFYVLASCGSADDAEAVARGLAELAEDRAVVVTASASGAEGLGALMAPTGDKRAGREALDAVDADLLLAVPPADSGILRASPLLRIGGPVVLIVSIGQTRIRGAKTVASLAEAHSAESLGLIVIGGRRSSARYHAPGIMT